MNKNFKKCITKIKRDLSDATEVVKTRKNDRKNLRFERKRTRKDERLRLVKKG